MQKSNLLSLVVVFGFTVFLVASITPIIRIFAIKKKIYDLPSEKHKTHLNPVPYLGGVSIALSSSIILVLGTLLEYRDSLPLVLSVILPSLALGAVGLLDDILKLPPLPRFLAQSITGLLISTWLFKTNTVGAETGNIIFDYILTSFFIVVICNSVNFFDNIDGGASGAVSISSFFVGLLCLHSNQFELSAVAFVLAGSAFGFLWWNQSPARIYMGDAGSLFLGVMLSSILIRFDPIPVSKGFTYFVVFFIVAIPLLDSAVAISSRIIRGKSPFVGGQDHLSHRLMSNGLSKVNAVYCLWTMSFVSCSLATFLYFAPYGLELLVILLGILMWLLSYIFFLRVDL
jgi:UDP-GlcNAc:undecaprenyl-phosphate GlcNAc-1-phosphate transferase